MPKNRFLLLGLVLLLLVVVGIVTYLGLSLRAPLSDTRQQQITQTETETGLSGQQIRRLLFKRLVNGEVEYVEILSNGEINIYDANMKLKKRGLIGFARMRQLFYDLEEYLGKHPGTIFSSCLQGMEITLETEQGITVIKNQPGACKDDQDPFKDTGQIIDELVDQLFSPTPTLIPSPTIIISHNQNPSPTTTNPNLLPTLTITPGGPTPIPDYQTAPPFTCEEYKYLGRPINISNVICGAD